MMPVVCLVGSGFCVVPRDEVLMKRKLKRQRYCWFCGAIAQAVLVLRDGPVVVCSNCARIAELEIEKVGPGCGARVIWPERDDYGQPEQVSSGPDGGL